MYTCTSTMTLSRTNETIHIVKCTNSV